MRELALFAGSGFLMLGLNELLVDLIWFKTCLARFWKKTGFENRGSDKIGRFPAIPSQPRLAVFIPAWRESDVIGAMLTTTLSRLHYENYRLYVGCYPNDPETIGAVEAVDDPRVRLVVGPRPGGTTKADCLNTIWRAMREDEARQGYPFAAVVLHDAEDVVHPDSFAWFGALIGRYDMIQLPVVPLIDSRSRWIAGHYADEFAESHLKDQAVRQHVGAALPSAGVGCAFARDCLAALAGPGAPGPFDAESLTEDYELGLKIGRPGRALFLRCRDAEGRLVATGEHFPAHWRAAIAQKSRWIAGIALAGWDRLGWRGGVGERWMRLRDRQPLLVALVTLTGYGVAAAWLLLQAFGRAEESPLDLPVLAGLAWANALLFAWRLTLRFCFTASVYGWREGLRAVPRMLVSTLILIHAALHATRLYVHMLRSGVTRWHKTSHIFPAELSGR
ncbi:glycosyl transferase family protein [Allosphingosinicella flava]|uniref:Glycosyl transferase family protein n=1 Tax=Allosphingosinicella flava TaxID=2771430 RepID=A0A7T2GIN2_9SPHN|nr:glycosyl transferase family protein [Sphingosinicella flava]QPQ54570.1 glycosyl transferase family protein [Sphingosinicella flava]